MTYSTISHEVTEEDKMGAWKDEYGVVYSKDGKKLLKCAKRDLTTPDFDSYLMHFWGYA